MGSTISGVDIGGAWGARAPPEFGGSEKGQSLISAYRSLAITASTSGFEKLSTALTYLPKSDVICECSQSKNLDFCYVHCATFEF